MTGGLSFFGGPFNNYMTHAACAMTTRLRQAGGVGLLYGQGEFVTKHHALVLATTPPAAALETDLTAVQAAADAARGPVPPIVTQAQGVAPLETFTILYDRAGQPERALAIVRTQAGARTLAAVALDDAHTLAVLQRQDISPIGQPGLLSTREDGLLQWKIA